MSDRLNRHLSPDDDEQFELHPPIKDEDEQATAVTRLRSEDEANQTKDESEKIRLVDYILRSAPLVLPSPEFAERVIEAIRKQDLQNMNRYTASGLVLGLGVAAGVIVYITAFTLITGVNILLNWTSFYRNMVLAFGSLSNSLSTTLSDFNSLVSDSPLLVALSLLSIPLGIVWWRLMHRLLSPVEGEIS